MSKEHYWVFGRIDQYVNGFYRDDEPEKMTLMPARWETAVGYLIGGCTSTFPNIPVKPRQHVLARLSNGNISFLGQTATNSNFYPM